MKKFVYGLLIVVVLAAIFVVGSYNGLVNAQEGVNSAWGQVQAVYQRRTDLIPNLVATVKGYAKHENQTLVAVTKARQQLQQQLTPANSPLNAKQLQAFDHAQGQLSQALGRLMVVVERYPNLKASQNFLTLQAQLEGTENRINIAREDYNKVVQTYNVKLRRFPTVMVAHMLGYTSRPYFKASQAAATAPKVTF